MDERALTRLLDMRRAGLSVARIAAEVELPEAEVAELIDRELPRVSIEEARRLELDRLDRLQVAVWAKAIRGDLAAIDRAMKLSTLRLQVAGAPLGQTPMTEAYDALLAELDLSPADAVLVEAGRWIVRRIDAAANSGDLAAEGKAVFMVPHLVNVLRELGATPATRDAMTRQVEAAVAAAAPKENDLEQFKRTHQRPG